MPTTSLKEHKGAAALQHWARQERQAWLDAVAMDPLLPQQLLPKGYLGQSTWCRRAEVLNIAGEQLQEFDQ